MSELRPSMIDADSDAMAPSGSVKEGDAPLSAAGRKVLRHASHYSLGSLFSVAAGLVTFPLLTRTLSVADYGLLSWLAATLSVAVAFGKTGLQHALIRYFSEISAGKSPFSLKQLHATAIIGMLASSVVVMVALMVGARLAPGQWLADERMRGLLFIVAVLVVVQVLDSALTNLLVADQQSAAVLKYQFTKRYLGLGALFVALLLIAPTLTAFWWAKALAEAAALLLPLWILFAKRRELLPRLSAFTAPLYRKLLAFGLPMAIGYELSGVVLNVGDRYVIEAMIGETELGLYSGAYSLCQYVQSVFVSSFGLAVMPIFMRMWDEEGPSKTSAFVGQSLRNYVLLSAPIIAGVASVGPELLPALASERYASVGHVLPWVSTGMVVDGAATLLGAGLFVKRRASTISAIVFGSAIANIAMNIVLVPRVGVLGAALATFGSYIVLCLGFSWFGQRLLKVGFPWRTAARAALVAAVMYLSLIYVLPGRRFLTVVVRAGLGASLYLGLIAWLDVDARTLASSLFDGLRARVSGGRRA